MNKIKAIICDWGGVFLKAGTGIALKRIYKIVNSPKRKVNEIFAGHFKKEGWLYRRGKLTKREFWKAAIKKLNINKKIIPKLQKTWHSSYKPIKGMREIISRLRRNYKVIAFSGTVKERVEYLDKKYGLLKNFDDFVLSFNVGFSKEDVEFYKILIKRLKKLKLKPEECVFIDDHQEFLDTAKSFGIKTLLFRNPSKLKTDLRKIGIKI
jgi:putative hydrolase of the HAD superfamily